jgi:hypothetical protein
MTGTRPNGRQVLYWHGRACVVRIWDRNQKVELVGVLSDGQLPTAWGTSGVDANSQDMSASYPFCPKCPFHIIFVPWGFRVVPGGSSPRQGAHLPPCLPTHPPPDPG